MVIRQNNILITNWYRKPTFSGRYVNYFSSHPHKYKISTILSLTDRAILLSDKQFHSQNILIIKQILLNNCYPSQLCDSIIKKRIKYLYATEGTQSSNNKKSFDTSNCVVLPYIKGLSEEVRRIMNGHGLDVLYTVPRKLDCLISKGKDQLPANKRTNVIYKLTCNDCSACYIGQTKRYLETRIKEHFKDIKKHESNYSVVSNHRASYNHDFNWSAVFILHNESNFKKREIGEMIYIKKHKDSINLQKDTDNLNSIYDSILNVF